MVRFRKWCRNVTVIVAILSLSLISLTSSAQAAPRTNDILNLESPPLVIEVGGPGLGTYKNNKTYARKVNLSSGGIWLSRLFSGRANSGNSFGRNG